MGRAYRQFPRRGKPFVPAAAVVVPVVSSWVHPVNQPYIKKSRQQPRYNPLPPLRTGESPKVSLWKHETNQSLKNRIRRPQQPQQYGQFWAQDKEFIVPSLEGWVQPTNQPLKNRIPKRQQPQQYGQFWAQNKAFVAPPILSWLHPVNQPVIKKKRQQPAPNIKPFVPAPAPVVPTGWQEPISQPRIVRKRQQPQYTGTFWAQNKAYVIPALEAWVQAVNQPVRGKRRQQQNNRVGVFTAAITIVVVPPVNQWVHPVNQPIIKKTRQQPRYNPVPPLRTGESPAVSLWKHETNQPLKKSIRRPQQPQYYGTFWAQNKAFVVPPLESWMQPTNQPLSNQKKRLQRQQVRTIGVFTAALAVTPVPLVTQWKQPVNQPTRKIKRQQPAPVPNFWAQDKAFVQPQPGFIQAVNQALRSRVPKRQQPRQNVKPFVPSVVPTGWNQPISQPLKSYAKKRQQPQRYINPFYDIPRPVPSVSAWIHPVNQPRIIKKRQQPMFFLQFTTVIPPPPGPGTLWINTGKGVARWTDNDVKLKTPWVNNINKNPTQYTPVAKTSSVWLNESVVQVSYLYDDPTLTYDNAYSYDYTNPQANQSNSLKPTPWTLNP